MTPHISPTNLGLLLTSQLAAHDFGYVSLDELSGSFGRCSHRWGRCRAIDGHFFNWYETGTLRPLQPQYVSTVDSGNLAASLVTLRQGCLLLLKQPDLGPATLDGLRDHVLRLRDEVPYAVANVSLMKLFGEPAAAAGDASPRICSFGRRCSPNRRDMIERIRTALADYAGCRTSASSAADELRYWETLLSERMDAALDQLYELAPWLAPALEPELRVCMRDDTLAPADGGLSKVPALGELPEAYERIRAAAAGAAVEFRGRCIRCCAMSWSSCCGSFRLPGARRSIWPTACKASRHWRSATSTIWTSASCSTENRHLLRIGYNVDAGRGDASYYDLLASEARTAVFLAIAKGDIPRESVAPAGAQAHGLSQPSDAAGLERHHVRISDAALYLRSYAGTLLDRALRGGGRIQQLYA